MTKKTHKIFQFKIMLNDIEPLIWRRVQVVSTDTFAEFHYIIQDVMGWEQCHLHEFKVRKNSVVRRIGIIDDEDYFDEPTENEDSIALNKIFIEEKQKVTYDYDFGDGWRHKIILEKILEPDKKPYPRCISGKNACPPEDCGGPWGYANLLEVLRDPKHDEHETMKEWYGEFDSEAFNHEDTDELLRSFTINETNTGPANKNNMSDRKKILNDIQEVTAAAIMQMHKLCELKTLDQAEIIDIMTGFVSSISSTAADIAEIISPGSGAFVYADIEALAKKGGITSIINEMEKLGSPQYSVSDMEDDDIALAMNYVGKALSVSLTKSSHELPKSLRSSEVQLRGIESLLANILHQRFNNAHDILDSMTDHVHLALNDLGNKKIH